MKTVLSLVLGFGFYLVSATTMAMNSTNPSPVAESAKLKLASMFNAYDTKRKSKPYWCCRKYVNGRLVSTRKTTIGAKIPQFASQGYQCTTIYNNAPCR